MIDALVSGKLYGAPQQRTAKTGKPFAVAKVRTALAGEGETIFISVIAFDDAPVSALLALGDGDSVALAGELTPKVWTDKQGVAKPALDLVAHQVLSAYHVQRKRKVIADAGHQSDRNPQTRWQGSPQ